MLSVLRLVFILLEASEGKPELEQSVAKARHCAMLVQTIKDASVTVTVTANLMLSCFIYLNAWESRGEEITVLASGLSKRQLS